MTLLLCFSQKEADAQDIHYSHLTFTPIYTNPAFTGYFEGNMRLYANYRNQFSTILGGSAFQTFTGSVDFSIPVGYFGKDFVGVGTYMFQDRVGKAEDGQFITTSIGLSGSYSKALSKNGNHALTIGLSAAFLQRRFNGSLLTFGSNFNPSDPENPIPGISTSTLPDPNQSYMNFDMMIGLIYLGKLSKKATLYTGFSVAHVLQPRWAFLSPNEGKLPIRYSAQLGMSLNLSKRVELAPALFYMHQGKIGELTLGNILDYRIVQAKGYETDFLFGVYMRTSNSPAKAFSFESLIVLLGIEYTDLRIAFSYDAQFGGLRSIAKTNSAFEISVKYTMGFLNSKPVSRNCPSF